MPDPAIQWTTAIFPAVRVLMSSYDELLTCIWCWNTRLSGETSLDAGKQSPQCSRRTASSPRQHWPAVGPFFPDRKSSYRNDLQHQDLPLFCFIILYWILKLLFCLARNTLSHFSAATGSSVDETKGGRATGEYNLESILGLVMTFRAIILGCIQTQASCIASVM